MRPLYKDRQSKKYWFEAAAKYGDLDKQLSNYNYYIRFVHENNRYPNKDEYILYLYNKQQNREENKMDTLPKEVIGMINQMFEDYQKVLKNIDVREFKKLTYNSMPKDIRGNLDGSNRF